MKINERIRIKQGGTRYMRKYLLWFISFMMIGLLITPAICTAGSKTRTYQSGSGAYLGKSVQQGNSAKYYNKQGSFVGRSERQGNEVRYYDKSGKMVTRTVQQGNTIKVYDRSGKMVGQSVQK
jgi:YD repeat-containing protein